MIVQNQTFLSSLDSVSQKIILEKLNSLVENLNKEVSGIFLLGSFATGEYSMNIDGEIQSDIEFLLACSNKISGNDILNFQRKINTNTSSLDPRLSLWLSQGDILNNEYLFDPITASHIFQTKSCLLGHMDYNALDMSISEESKLGLSGVAHMQYLKGILLGDLTGLIKGPLTQIGAYLLSINQYKASYRDKINEFKKEKDLIRSLGINEDDLWDLYTLKLCLDWETFNEKFGSIENYRSKFQGLFDKDFFKLLFSHDLLSYSDIEKEKSLNNETCLRIMYISLLNNELELSVKMINYLLNSYGNREQYNNIENLDQSELLQIGLRIHKQHVETLGVFD